jgi:hypothetical protein
MIEFPRRWRIFAYIDSRGKSVIEDWARDIKFDKELLARLNLKLDLLEHHGTELSTGLLAGTSFKHIDKLKIFGRKTAWRIMVCKGPVSNEFEFTLLFVAQEKDRKLIPKDAYKRADDNRKEIISNPERRRIHERIYGKVDD